MGNNGQQLTSMGNNGQQWATMGNNGQQWTTIRGATCICDAVFSTAWACLGYHLGMSGTVKDIRGATCISDAVFYMFNYLPWTSSPQFAISILACLYERKR